MKTEYKVQFIDPTTAVYVIVETAYNATEERRKEILIDTLEEYEYPIQDIQCITRV